MNVLKYLLLLPTVIFPYSFFLSMKLPGGSIWTWIGWFWLAGFVGVLIFNNKEDENARSMARVNMTVKLLHIPAYVLWFITGVGLFFFMGGILAFIIDVMTIVLSGLVGQNAVLHCEEEGLLNRKQALIHSVLQFIFCADVVSAIILYRKTKGANQ